MENKNNDPIEGKVPEVDELENSAAVDEINKIGEEVMYFDGLTEKALEKGVELNLPVLLVGETGTGKTSFIRSVANKKGAELTPPEKTTSCAC